MKKVNIKIANKKYTVELAETDEQKESGLQHRKSMSESEGMLFCFEENEPVGF